MAKLQSGTIIYGTANVLANLTSGSVNILGSGNGIIFVDGTYQTTNAASFNFSTQGYLQANNAASFANGAFTQANSAASFANGAFTSANNLAAVNTTQNTNITSAQSFANSAFNIANLAYSQANIATPAFAQANNAFNVANVSYAQANNAASFANSAFTLANNTTGVDNTQNTNISSAQSYANSAFTQANNAASFANGAFTAANVSQAIDNTQNTNISSAQSFANSAFTKANNALANTTGTFAGDLTIAGNLFVNGTTTTVNTETLLVGDNLVVLNSDIPTTVPAPSINSGIEINRGLYQNTQLVWSEVSNAWRMSDGNTFASISSANLTQAAFGQANNAFNVANGAFVTANSAASFANGSFVTANSAASFANGAFTSANNLAAVNTTQNTNISSAQSFANGAFTAANVAFGRIQITANTGDLLANGVNTPVTGNILLGLATTAVAAGTYGGASQIPVITIDTKGRATYAANVAFSGGATITDDTTTNATRYPLLSTSTSGSLSTSNTSSTKLTYVPSTGLLTSTLFNATGDVTGSRSSGAISYGTINYSDVNMLASFASSANTYNQMLLQNASNGTEASTNFVVSNDLATNSTFYGELGMNSSGFVGGSTSAFDVANTVYLASQSSSLAIGTYGLFPIRFVINNGASDAMTIAANGNVGIGTTSPTQPLTIYNSTNSAGPINVLGDGNSSTITSTRYASDQGGGQFAIQKARGTFASPTVVVSGDQAGQFTARAFAGTNFRTLTNIISYVDTVVSDTNISGILAFNTNGGSTGTTERMRITSNGGISFGSSGTAYGTSGQVLTSNGDAPPTWNIASAGVTLTDDTSTNSTHYVLLEDVTSGSVTTAKVSSTKLTFNPSTGTLSATIFTTLSDENKKTNIKPIENALNIVENIKGVTFDWKESNLPSAGLIAQDVEKYLPELIETSDQNKTLNYNGVIGILVEAIKELNEKVKQLENKE